MQNLNLLWKATFKDGSTLNQINTNGKEIKFQKVLDRFSDLVSFKLKHTHKPLQFTVDLRKGLIYINSPKYTSLELYQDKKKNIRLIYFRRHRVDQDIRGEVLNRDVFYFLGYQFCDSNNRNHKVILNIDQEGNVVLGAV